LCRSARSDPLTNVNTRRLRGGGFLYRVDTDTDTAPSFFQLTHNKMIV